MLIVFIGLSKPNNAVSLANKHDIRICKYFTNQAVKPTRLTCLYTSNGNIVYNQNQYQEKFGSADILTMVALNL